MSFFTDTSTKKFTSSTEDDDNWLTPEEKKSFRETPSIGFSSRAGGDVSGTLDSRNTSNPISFSKGQISLKRSFNTAIGSNQSQDSSEDINTQVSSSKVTSQFMDTALLTKHHTTKQLISTNQNNNITNKSTVNLTPVKALTSSKQSQIKLNFTFSSNKLPTSNNSLPDKTATDKTTAVAVVSAPKNVPKKVDNDNALVPTKSILKKSHYSTITNAMNTNTLVRIPTPMKQVTIASSSKYSTTDYSSHIDTALNQLTTMISTMKQPIIDLNMKYKKNITLLCDAHINLLEKDILVIGHKGLNSIDALMNDISKLLNIEYDINKDRQTILTCTSQGDESSPSSLRNDINNVNNNNNNEDDVGRNDYSIVYSDAMIIADTIIDNLLSKTENTIKVTEDE